jgi:hypothetical protein
LINKIINKNMKKRIFTVVSALLILLAVLSCEETTINFEGLDSNQTSLLLVSTDSFKIWQRETLFIDSQNQPLTGCDQYQQLKFEISDEGDSIFTNSVSPLNGCPAETLISGQWKISAGPVDTLVIFNSDTSVSRMINNITSRNLEYYYFENNSRVTERFISL